MDGLMDELYEPVECSALEPDDDKQMVSRAAFEQVMWERDIALKQLAEIGKGLGERWTMLCQMLFTAKIVPGTMMLKTMVMILRYAIITIGK